LPFTNLSGDPEQEYFADGITEDIITELSRFNEFIIIARNSSFHYKGQSPRIEDVGRELGVKYVVEGSVRRAAERVRVTAQLIDTETESHIWADRYDRRLDDIFAIQDEVTEAVVARVADKVKGAVTTLSRSRPKQSVTAYDLVLQSRPHRTSMTRSGNEKAAELLTQAIALDPDYALAYASLAFVRASDYEEFWAADQDAARREAMAAARRAVALDDSDGYAHSSLAYVHNICGNFDLAAHEARLALSLNPNHVNIIMMSGWLCVVAGDPEAGIEHIQRARRLNPYMGGFELWTLGLAFFGAKRYEEAIDAFSQVTDPPTSQFMELAAAYAYLGRDDDARDAMNVFLQRAKDELKPFPGDDPQAWRRYMDLGYARRHKDDFEHILEGARRAGLPV
jgi:adenylate cyclase